MLSDAMRDRFDGLANPLLIKEMYQSLHSWKFLVALWLMLGCSLTTYVTVFSGSEGETCGDKMFWVFAFFMYVACVFVLPYLAFANLSEEVKSGTIELIHITRMNSRKHVRGRLLASVAKIGLVFSMIGPFAVAAFLFKGIDVVSIVMVLILTLFFSVLACSIAVFFGALTVHKQMQSIARILFILLLIYGVIMPFSVFGGLRFTRGFGSPDLSELSVVLAAYVVITMLLVWFFSAAAANILTFDADKCSAKTKFVLLLIVAALCAIFCTPLYFGQTLDGENILIFASFASVAVLVCGSFWLTLPNRVASRFQKRFRTRSLAYRAVIFPLMDGAGSSALYMFVVYGSICLIALLMYSVGGGGWEEETLFPVLMCMVYAFFLSAVSFGTLRLLPRKFRKTMALRGVFLGLVVANLVISILLGVAVGYRRMPEPSLLTGFFPIVHLMSMERATSYSMIDLIVDLGGPAVIGITVHVILILRHFRRYTSGVYN